jgi:hypothetical protein
MGKNTDQQGNTEIKYKYSNKMNTSLKEGEGEALLQRPCLQGGETRLWRGRLIYGGGDSSTERETRLQRGRLVCRGGDSPTDGEACLRRK